MSKKYTNMLLTAAIVATTALTFAVPVSATPVWLPGKEPGQPFASAKSSEVTKAERKQRAIKRQQRIKERGAERRGARTDQYGASTK